MCARPVWQLNNEFSFHICEHIAYDVVIGFWWIFSCCGYLCRSIFFLHWAIYLSHSHSHTFSMSCERYSASIVIIIPNTTCNVCFFFIRFTVKIHTFRKPKKNSSKWTDFHWVVLLNTIHWRKRENCRKHFPGVIIVMFNTHFCHVCGCFLFHSRLFSFVAWSLVRSLSLSVLCNQLFNYFVLYSLYDFPSSQCRLPYEISSFTWKWHNITLPVTYTCCSFRSREKKRQHGRIWHRQQHQQTFQ